MESLKKVRLALLLSGVALVLTGCWGKKKNAKNQNDESSVSSKKKKSKKKWDSNLGAYVFEGEDASDMVALNDLEDKQFEKIHFGFDKTSIEESERPALAYNVDLAKEKAKEGKALVVLGKSDTHCISEVYNTAVSQNRADTLAREFMVAGVSRDHVSAIGLGDTQLEVNVRGKEARNRVAVVQVQVA